MLKSKPIEQLTPYFLLFLLFCTSIIFRPLLPIDETRYLTVAWEMFLTKNLFVPTLNFAPYFQKPPLLFWLIDLVWTLFGVSRTAALGVIFVASSLAIYLTRRLARSLFPERSDIADLIPWLMLGNVVFMIYSSLILFDLLLTVFVLAASLSLIDFARTGRWRFAILAGVFVGLGVLTKGPVMLIHIIWPVLLYPFWRDREATLPSRTFFAGTALAFGAAFFSVMLWLVPAIGLTGSDFFHDLVWKQAAGRITGNLNAAHSRPFYFYVLLLPIMFLPWAPTPDIWRSKPLTRVRKLIEARSPDFLALRLLSMWSLGIVVVFSLISGKQPHYLVPLLPLVTIILAYFMVEVPAFRIKLTTVIMLALFGVGQAIASATLFKQYDFGPLASFIHDRRDADWAFSGNYQGQVGFLARIEKPFTIVRAEGVDDWLRSHPGGYLIQRRRSYPDDARGVVFSAPVTQGYFVVFSGSD